MPTVRLGYKRGKATKGKKEGKKAGTGKRDEQKSALCTWGEYYTHTRARTHSHHACTHAHVLALTAFFLCC